MDVATRYDRIRETVNRIAAMGDNPEDDADLRMRKHALALSVVGLIPATVLWVLIGILIGRPLLVGTSAAFAIALLIGLAAFSRLKVFAPLVRVLLLTGMAYVFMGHVALGGLAAGGASLAWGIIAPISAVLYFDGARGLKWLGAYAAMVIAAIALDGVVISLLPASWEIAPVWLFAYNLLGPAMVILLLILYVDGQRLAAQHQARSLLLDVLPSSIAERLARGERLIVDTHPSATVLFADVVNFTGLAANISPRDLLLILNQLFSIFDRVAARHGVEKIKTIGDAYVAMAGAPVPHEDHARAALETAIEMHRAVARLGGLRRRGLRLRVGVASGPVTAGVIGENRWAYDIWGDTVNMAARMESSGVPGLVQIAPATRELLGDDLPMQPRTIQVKGKGQVTTWIMDPADAARSPRHREDALELGGSAESPAAAARAGELLGTA